MLTEKKYTIADVMSNKGACTCTCQVREQPHCTS